MRSSKEGNGTWLAVIAVFKLVKAALLVAIAVGFAHATAKGPEETIAPWLDAVHFDARGRLIHEAAARLLSLDRPRLGELAVGGFAYAALFTVEGVGLLLRRRWAEYLTLFVTVSLLPFEIVELVRHSTAPRWITLVLNVAVVAYLGARMFARHSREHSKRRPSSHAVV